MMINGVEVAGGSTSGLIIKDQCDGSSVQVTRFSDVLEDGVALHFQIIHLPKQSNTVGVTSLIGGASDNTGSVIKTGLNVVLASNIQKIAPCSRQMQRKR
ncbi:hypothetical protein ACS0TY_027106 [Phlomoides rotata]